MEEIILFIQRNHWTRKIIITVLGFILTVFLTKFINNVFFRTTSNSNKFYTLRKRTYYAMSILYIVSMIFVWLEMAGSFSTYMGLLSAGVAIALKDIFSNMAGWLFIILRRPFSVGERILIDGYRGDVIDIRIFQFSLIEINEPDDGEQSTGRIVEIPNNFVFLYPVVNYVKGFKYIWNEIKVEITFESDWKKAKRELEKIVERHTMHFTGKAKKEIEEAARKYMIYYNKFTPIVYTDVRASGVLLTMRYLCAPKDKRNTINDIWEDILNLINSSEDIDLAYPTKRVVK